MPGALDVAVLAVLGRVPAALPLTCCCPAGPTLRFFGPNALGVLPNVAPPVPMSLRRLAMGKRVLHVEQTGMGLQKTE